MASAVAGPLSRFFAARDGGDPARYMAGVQQWQRDLLAALASKPTRPQPWREDATAALTVELGEAAVPSLRLFALYAERADLELPATAPLPLELDRSWRQAAEAAFAGSLYAQLLAPTLWLPGSFPFTCRAPLPDGAAAEIGSLPLLDEQLRRLNQRTFQADAAAMAAWAGLPATAGCDLLDAARAGHAGLAAAAAFAVQHALPLLLREA